MSEEHSLPDNKKLTVLLRVEPGCLGPKGADLVEAFCQFAGQNFKTIQANIINWEISPRFDKSLEEIQYKINNKTLNNEKVSKYLNLFDIEKDQFEENIHDTLAVLIDTHLGH